MKLYIHHTTSYHYDVNVAHSTQYLRLTPGNSSRQKILSWNLKLPAAAPRSLDAYGNIMHVITIDFPHQDIVIEAEGYVDIDNCSEEAADKLSPLLFLRTTPYIAADQKLHEFARPFILLAKEYPREAAWQMMIKLREQMNFQGGETNICTKASEAFAQKQGVCQDYAHIFLACAHVINLPARYVSGYLYTDNCEHVSSHAWVEIWVGNYWWGLDIANGIEAGHHHLKLAVGRDYMEACPVRGIRHGGGTEFHETKAVVRMMDQ